MDKPILPVQVSRPHQYQQKIKKKIKKIKVKINIINHDDGVDNNSYNKEYRLVIGVDFETYIVYVHSYVVSFQQQLTMSICNKLCNKKKKNL